MIDGSRLSSLSVGIVINPSMEIWPSAATASSSSSSASGDTPPLLFSPPRLTSRRRRRRSALRGCGVQGLREVEPIERVYEAKEGQGLPHLVALQTSDQVPIHLWKAKLRGFAARLLNVVLADLAGAGRNHLPYPVGAERLCGDDDGHFGGGSSRADGRLCSAGDYRTIALSARRAHRSRAAAASIQRPPARSAASTSAIGRPTTLVNDPLTSRMKRRAPPWIA